MEKQKKTIKISLKTAILIFFIIAVVIIGFSIVIWNHFEKNKNDNAKLSYGTETINTNKNKKYDTIEYIGETGTLGVTIYKDENKTDFELIKLDGETICNFEELSNICCLQNFIFKFNFKTNLIISNYNYYLQRIKIVLEQFYYS